MLLSILCVTKAEPFARPFLLEMHRLAQAASAELVLAGDGDSALPTLCDWGFMEDCALISVESKGFLESVLEVGVKCCSGKYILRLDDDECCSSAMTRWVIEHAFTAADHWKFPRMHLWPTTHTFIEEAPLWPDHQTRLSVKAKSGGRTTIHAGSPFGGGRLAPVAIEHHKFLVKSRAERAAIAARYDVVSLGYGTGGMLPFNLPEDVYSHMNLPTTHTGELLAARDAD